MTHESRNIFINDTAPGQKIPRKVMSQFPTWFFFCSWSLYFKIMEGWIKLYRRFSEWEWFNISEMVHLFIYLLINANHEDGEWRGVSVKRGQLLTGLKTLNERTNISYQTLRTCLKRLEKTKEINIQVTNKYSIITICNYECYQDRQQITNKQANKQLTSSQQTTNKQLTTNNNKENNRNEKNERNIIPPTLEMVKKYCDIRNNNIDAQYFIDKNTLIGWVYGKNKIPITDWQAQIRTWEKYNTKVGKPIMP